MNTNDPLRQIATDCIAMLEGAGYGKPGTANTLWGMCHAVCKDVKRLRRDVARLEAKAAYFEHDSECCGGCTECSRLYTAWQALEEGGDVV